MILRVIK